MKKAAAAIDDEKEVELKAMNGKKAAAAAVDDEREVELNKAMNGKAAAGDEFESSNEVVQEVEEENEAEDDGEDDDDVDDDGDEDEDSDEDDDDGGGDEDEDSDEEVQEVEEDMRYEFLVQPVVRADATELDVQLKHLIQHTYALTVWQKGVIRNAQRVYKINKEQKIKIAELTEEINRLKIEIEEDLTRLQKEVSRAIETYKSSAAYREERDRFVEKNSHVYFKLGWDQCVQHIMSVYPNLDPARLAYPYPHDEEVAARASSAQP